MRSRLTTLFCTTLLFCFGAVTTAQTPSRAIDLYQQGTVKLGKGEIDSAIDDFTRAIELSSRLGPINPGRPTRAANGFSPTDELANVTVVDPFTAYVYVNRGVARMRKNDFEAAIED